ncbi:MAG: gliding motility-associated C-terminal domain-containing protein [Lewinellaceae bacterium]|nr:gliding motility-associated C-terminal domain-containing protein [Lewinellaceae bacterium]
MNVFTCWLLLLLSTTAWRAKSPVPVASSTLLDCSVSVDAGPDQTICEPGQPVNLNANVSGNLLSIQWSPSTGLSNPNIPNPVATVNGTTTYTVMVSAASNQNLITNWDFSQGFAGFSSDYIPGNGGPFGLLSNEGTYAVASNPALTHTNFASFGDITGDGSMLVVNGAGTPNQIVLCQTVSVTPNTNYAFSTYVASAISSSPAQLQFSVNGQLIGNIFNASSTPGLWQQFYATWNSGGSTTADICIVNQNTAASGNDFCLDGLFFSELCDAFDDVTITLVQLNADFTPPTGLCVGSLPFDMNPYLSPNATPGGSWMIDGLPTSYFDPAVLGAGVHNVTYTVTQAPCSETVSFPVTVDPLPQANWAIPFGICQADPPLDMDNWLYPGTLPGGSWTINGQPSVGEFNPAIWGPGQHLVSYTIGTPPCTNEFSEFVEVSPVPSASFSIPAEICDQAPAFDLNTLLDPGATPGGSWIVNGTSTSIFDPSALPIGANDVIYQVGNPPCDAFAWQTILITNAQAPVPACGQVGNDFLTVEWPSVSGATGYSVEVVSGQTGGILNGNTFTLNGLAPGETASFVIFAENDSACPPSSSDTIQCSTLECTPPVVVIQDETARCEDDPSFSLIAMVADSFPAGAWSGPGIIDTLNGVFDPAAAGPGIHTVQFITNPDGCPGQGVASIEVLPAPVAEFTLPDSICILDTALIQFTGMADTSATFTWDFDGGNSAAPPNDTLQRVTWSSPGQKVISLQIDQDGCLSEVFSDAIEVQPLLQPPLVNCRSTETSVEFYWPSDPAVDSFLVMVLSAHTGIMPSDTSFLVDGLTPGEAVAITVTALSANACPDTMVLASCIAEACPDIVLSIPPAPDICLSGNGDTITLTATLTGGPADGVYTWQGPGIVDSLSGLFSPGAAGIGAHTINLTYTRGSCSYNTSTSITVRPTPVAAFTADSLICLTDPAQVSFTGTAGPNATFNWDFDGGTAGTGTPFSVTWPAPGIYTISLQIEEEGCLSEPAAQTVQVDDTLSVPVITCEADYTSVTFQWNRITDAFAYLVNVTDGPAGTLLNDTTLLVDGLEPGQAVSIALEASSANACPSVTATASCAALPCPNVSLNLETPPDQCFDNSGFNIPLQVDVLNDTGNGSLTWSGAGITDPTSNQWTVDAGQIGQPNPIIATWTEDVCTVSDTAFLNVYANPTPDFTATPVICLSDEATISYTGTASPAASFTWGFDGGAIVSGSGAGPYQIHWDSPGNYTINLQVEENGCSSALATQTVQVDDTLSTPAIQCEATYTSVSFSWNDIPNASAYQVEILDGPPGTMDGPAGYLIEGLQPGQQVSIGLTALSDNACPAVATTAICAALPCPDVSLAIQPPAGQCFDGTPFTISLQADIQNDTGNGSLSWSGAGITDPASGNWTVDAGQAGQPNLVIATWTEDVCSVSDSVFLNVYANPTADFSATPIICVEGQATILYNGTATPAANYNWDFDGADVISGSGAGPFQLQWPAAGAYTISLQVEENGCSSVLSTRSVQVDPVLQAPIVECEPGFGTVLFSWSPVSNASGYQVDGPGAMLTDTSYQVNGLLPGEEAGITVTALSANACPAVSIPASCNALLCPDATVSMTATPAICAGEEALLEITFFGDGGPYNMTLLIDGQPMMLNGIEEGYSTSLPLTASTLFRLENIVDTGHPNCTLPSPPSVTTVVRQPVTAGTPAGPFELCSRTNTSIQLFNLLEDEQPGGAWSLTDGPALLPGAFNPNTGIFLPGQQPPGTYLFSYNITAQAPCPNDSASIPVIINERPVADAGEDITLSCTFNIGSLGGSGTSTGPALEYNWSSDDDVDIMNPEQPYIDISQPGTYQLTVLDTRNGCSDTDQAIVDSEIAFLVPYASVSPISCFQSNDGLISIDSISGGTMPYRYSLNGGPFTGSPAFVPLGPGTYDIAIEDATGCRAELQFQLEEPNELQVVLLANIQAEDNSIQIGDSIQLQALVNIPAEEVDKVYWQPDSLGCDTCLSATFSPQISTIFSVQVTDINGCTAEDMERVIVRKNYNVFIPNVFSPNGDGRNDAFMIFAGKEVKEIKTFMVFNRWGETVFEHYNFQPNDPAHGWDGAFRGQPMNDAVFVYFAEIEMVDGQVVLFKGDVTLMR